MAFSFKILLSFAIISIFSGVHASDNNKICDVNDFENVYYLINSEDYPFISRFYFSIPLLRPNTDSDFISFTGYRDRIRTYYDFQNQDILAQSKELVFIHDANLPIYFDDREQVEYVDNQTTPKNIRKFDVKNYNKKVSTMDKHPLFSRVKRNERANLIEILDDVSGDHPESVAEVLNIKSKENLHIISLYGITYGEIVLSDFSISSFGVPNTYFLFSINILEAGQDQLTNDERRYLNSIFCRIDENFRHQFPHIEPYSWFGYFQYNELALLTLANRSFFLRNPELFLTGQIICLTVIFSLIFYLLLGRYSKIDKCHVVKKK